MRELWHLFGTELVWVTVPGLIALVFAASRLRRGAREHNIRIVARLLIVAGALVAGAMLFSPVTRTTHAHFLDVHLLATLRSSFRSKLMFSQMVGNILLLSWLGLLLPIAFRRVRPWLAAIVVMLSSVAVETVQYLIDLGRVSSVSDVFFNTIGGLLGAAAAKLVGARLLGRSPRSVRPVPEYGTVSS